jgi:hypothetical protein
MRELAEVRRSLLWISDAAACVVQAGVVQAGVVQAAAVQAGVVPDVPILAGSLPFNHS